MTLPKRSPRLAYALGAVVIWWLAFLATLGYGLAVLFADLLAWQVVGVALCWGIVAGLGISHLLRVWQSVCGLGADAPD